MRFRRDPLGAVFCETRWLRLWRGPFWSRPYWSRDWGQTIFCLGPLRGIWFWARREP